MGRKVMPGLGVPWVVCWVATGQVLVSAGLCSHHRLSHMFPGSAQEATNYELLCSSDQIALGQSQAMAYLALHGSPTQEVLEQKYVEAAFRSQHNTTWLAQQVAHPKSGLGRHQRLLGWIMLHGVSHSVVAYVLWVWPVFMASQPEVQSYSRMWQYSRIN